VTNSATRGDTSSRRPDVAILISASILYLAITCGLAARVPLWYDELFTVYLADLPRVGDIGHALAAGADGNPPLYHLVTRLFRETLGPSELATRLPAVLGFWVMSLGVYCFVSRRCRRPFAMAAMLFPLATAVYVYAYNARPYGWLLGCCGLALVCWQSAADGRRRRSALAGLAISLSAAFASHYYAVLLLAPFGVGEITRTWTRRRVDWPIWLALAAGPVTLALLLPLALEARRDMSQFGFSPGWAAIPGSYWFLLKSARWPLIATLAVAAVFRLWFRSPDRVDTTCPGGPPMHEIAAAGALAAIPIVGVCLGQWVTGFYTPRYAAPAIVGLAILLAFAADRGTTGFRALALVLVAIFIARFAQAGWREYRAGGELRAEIAERCVRLDQQAEPGLPVAVADPFAFLQLTYYAPPPLRGRLVYLSDVAAARRRNPTDPRDWVLRQLRRWTAVSVDDYRDFLATHSRFFVFGDDGWLPATLAADGVRCRPCAGPALYEARAMKAQKAASVDSPQ
jgi:hypothetical protein